MHVFLMCGLSPMNTFAPMELGSISKYSYVDIYNRHIRTCIIDIFCMCQTAQLDIVILFTRTSLFIRNPYDQPRKEDNKIQYEECHTE